MTYFSKNKEKLLKYSSLNVQKKKCFFTITKIYYYKRLFAVIFFLQYTAYLM